MARKTPTHVRTTKRAAAAGAQVAAPAPAVAPVIASVTAPTPAAVAKAAPAQPAPLPATNGAVVAPKTVQAEATPVAVVTQEMIARRAYELFMARGGVHGDPMQDWLQAERELRGGRN